METIRESCARYGYVEPSRIEDEDFVYAADTVLEQDDNSALVSFGFGAMTSTQLYFYNMQSEWEIAYIKADDGSPVVKFTRSE